MMQRRLVEEIKGRLPLDAAVEKAMASVDRKVFVPGGFVMHAYKLDALPMTATATISSPLTVARMTQALEPSGVDGILEIGCGSGYQAAVLSRLARRVFTIERVEKLLEEAKGRFKRLGLSNINTRLGDGQAGWREFAPYERILLSASTEAVPQALFDQLADGGILVAPIDQGGRQVIIKYTKRGRVISRLEVAQCNFVPILSGIEKS